MTPTHEEGRMTEETPEPGPAPARVTDADITPAPLGRVLAEARSIQAMSLDGDPVWFEAQTIARCMGADEERVSRALAALHLRGDIAMAIHWPKNGEKAGLIYALAEAVDNDESPEGA